LRQPNGCPNEVYKLMLECWGESGASRKQPQAIVRDINQILYQVYNSRRIHAYATAFPKLSNDADEDNSSIEDTNSSYNIKSYASNLFINNTSSNWNDSSNCKSQLS